MYAIGARPPRGFAKTPYDTPPDSAVRRCGVPTGAQPAPSHTHRARLTCSYASAGKRTRSKAPKKNLVWENRQGCS